MKRIMRKILALTILVLFNVIVNGQTVTNPTDRDLPTLTKILESRGYTINGFQNQQVLERYIALDTKLKEKQDSVNNIFKPIQEFIKYVDKDMDYETLSNIESFHVRSKYIKNHFKSNTTQDYSAFLNEYENNINKFGNSSKDVEDIKYLIGRVMLYKERFEKNSIREVNEKKELASLPTKEVIKTKFRNYTHKTGNVFEWFPVGFNPKGGNAVIDKVFNRKARYREVDGNGMNTFIIEYYNSGSLKNVTVYGGKGIRTIYYAEYRDKATKPYEIRTYSADGKFYVVHNRTYDMYDDKITLSTKYQYVPLEHWYE